VSERSYLNPVFPTLAPFTALTLPAGSKNDMKPVKKSPFKGTGPKGGIFRRGLVGVKTPSMT